MLNLQSVLQYFILKYIMLMKLLRQPVIIYVVLIFFI